jgi:hypothetical protein
MPNWIAHRPPKLTPALKQQLARIEQSRAGAMEYFPCDLTLKDGKKIDRVYVVSEARYTKHFRMYPERDPAKGSIDLNEVLSITESVHRLPVKFANRLYELGESGMGYYAFTVVFESGTDACNLTGGFVDFVNYPEGFTKLDIVEVIPHTKGATGYIDGPRYSWCALSE